MDEFRGIDTVNGVTRQCVLVKLFHEHGNIMRTIEMSTTLCVMVEISANGGNRTQVSHKRERVTDFQSVV